MAEIKKAREVSRAKAAEDVHAILLRAEEGDESVLTIIREMMQCKSLIKLCGGELSVLLRTRIIKNVCGKNLAFKEALYEKMKCLTNDLSGPNPTALEKLLVDRIVTCWLHLHTSEAAFQQRESMTLAQANHYDRLISRAQKRYLASVKVLAQVRKMALPALQINVAKKQVNLAG